MQPNPPLILISAATERRGEEFGDLSLSLSARYQQAIVQAGGAPVVLAMSGSRSVIRATVEHCDGVLLTGGDDIAPSLYGGIGDPELLSKVKTTPDHGERDFRELVLIDEVFSQRKPLLAICRGHQLVNVALGGTLFADIPSQIGSALNHNRMDKRDEIVHQVQLTLDSLMARIFAGQTLHVNSTHHQGVNRVAEPLEVTAISEDGLAEALEFKAACADWLPFFLSVQFHPERLARKYPEHRRCFDAFTLACALSRDKKI